MSKEKNLNNITNKTINISSPYENIEENDDTSSALLKNPISKEDLGEKEYIFICCSKLIMRIKSKFCSKTSSNLEMDNNSAKISKLKIIWSFVIIALLLLFYHNKNIYLNYELNLIEKYIRKNLDGHLVHSKALFKKVDEPKISIVISVFNGEAFIKPVVRSVQNQNILDLEIIIVDDASQDNSVQIIKELMEEDPRIKLLLNRENKGALYTKSRGVLNAKGKYVMTLDQDNLYTNENAFSILYDEAKRNNLDFLGFSAIEASINISISTVVNYFNYFKSPVIKKPDIKGRFMPGEKIENESSTFLWCYFVRTSLYLDVLKDLGDDIINRNIDLFDDVIIVLLLARKASKLKHIKKIFYIALAWPEQNKVTQFHDKIKTESRERRHCLSYITFSEVLLLFTGNNISDKNRAEGWFKNLIINNDKCNKKKDLIKRICKLYLNDEYISQETKSEIKLLLND